MRNSKSNKYRMLKENKKVISGNSILFLIGLVLFLGAGIQLLRIGLSYYQGTTTYEHIVDLAVKVHTREDQSIGDINLPDWAKAISVDFDTLNEMNIDVVGWIYVDGMDINYPILQGVTNDTYLHTLADRTSNFAGSIFLEALNLPDFSDYHTIVYGHNMKNNSMFGSLDQFKTDNSFYSNHQFFTIFTPNKAYRYQIFSYYDVLESNNVYSIGYSASDKYQSLIDKMKQSSYLDTGVKVSKENYVVTLSTCSIGEKRFVVHGVLVDECMLTSTIK